MIEQIKLNIDFGIFLNADYAAHEGSCIKHQVYEQKDTHDRYGGFPSTFVYNNTVIHQLWWDRSQVDYEALDRQLNMEVITVSSIMQEPGCMIPIHRDEFYQIKVKYPDRTEERVRANIFLEDWKDGHFLQYDNIIANPWKAGEGFMWNRDVLHLSANAGMEKKYTLQISGFYKGYHAKS